jgi:hypothetical protein
MKVESHNVFDSTRPDNQWLCSLKRQKQRDHIIADQTSHRWGLGKSDYSLSSITNHFFHKFSPTFDSSIDERLLFSTDGSVGNRRATRNMKLYFLEVIREILGDSSSRHPNPATRVFSKLVIIELIEQFRGYRRHFFFGDRPKGGSFDCRPSLRFDINKRSQNRKITNSPCPHSVRNILDDGPCPFLWAFPTTFHTRFSPRHPRTWRPRVSKWPSCWAFLSRTILLPFSTAISSNSGPIIAFLLSLRWTITF